MQLQVKLQRTAETMYLEANKQETGKITGNIF